MPELHFTVDSALLSELGEKLVETVHIALLELVKNAYDADATNAIVAMTADAGDYRIQVIDNGVGMAFKDVGNYWMRIATTNKARHQYSARYGRKRSGSKGIGRFSCRRLGSNLSLKTTALLANGRYETTSLTIDWDNYTPGTDVTEITCEGERSVSRKGSTGTTLEITGGGGSEWSHRSWGVLKRRLIQLVSNRGAQRDGFEPDPGFNVSLLAPDFEESTVVDQREVLMDAGWGRLSLDIDERGKAVWTLTAKRIGRRQLTLPDDFPRLAGTTADIAILPDRKTQFRNPRAIAITALRDTLDEWGGVHVRVDGIRVFPFGEQGDDWLFIDRDRGLRRGKVEYSPVARLAGRLRGVDENRALLNMLSSRSYVGEVNLTSPSELFEMRASREGFVGEEGVGLLQTVIRTGIDLSTVYRDFYIRQQQEDDARQTREDFEQILRTTVRPEAVIEDAVEYVKTEIRQVASHLPTSERRRVVQNIAKAASAVLHSDRLHRQELKHLRLVASTSSLLLVFSHEVRSLLSMLDKYKMGLLSLRQGLSRNARDQIGEMITSMDFTKARFNDLLGMTSLLSVDSRDATEERLALVPRAEKAKACFDLIITKYGLDVDITGIPNAHKVGPLLEAELYSVLLNALSNAIKSVIASGHGKEIALTSEGTETGTKLSVLDTGLGVPEAWHDLFTPFVADPDGQMYRKLKRRLNPEDKDIVGTGSGLGLSIIREIVEARGGTVGFVKPTGKWKCSLEIVLP